VASLAAYHEIGYYSKKALPTVETGSAPADSYGPAAADSATSSAPETRTSIAYPVASLAACHEIGYTQTDQGARRVGGSSSLAALVSL
jgi:hypothetical protein